MLAQRLEEYAGADAERERRQKAADDFVQFARTHSGSSNGRGWTREELYEERLEKLLP